MSGGRAIFLDRDGVLNELVPDRVSGRPESPLSVEDVRLVEGVGGLARLGRAGFMLLCVSNQPAAAKGTVSLEQLHAVHERVVSLLSAQGVGLEASRLCVHHPQGIVAELAGGCDCRKPAPGMLLELARTFDVDLGSSWMVGDTDADVQAGRVAGCRTVLVEYPGSAHKRTPAASPDLRVVSLAEAIARIGQSETARAG